MKYFISTTAILMFLLLSYSANAENADPKKLIEQMTEVTGSYEDLKSMKDVEYIYTVTNEETGNSDISEEKYIFDGELSWAKYIKRENDTFSHLQGEVVQGYNGKESWMTLNGELVTDEGDLKYADFLRKTNFYWFAMMQKLLDPGTTYSYEGKEKLNGTEYDLVKISYEPGIGDVSDTYVLFINPETHLVDQFLFTVMDFGVTEPLLMKVEYKQFGDVKLPVYRKFTWPKPDGGGTWIVEKMTDLKFNNGFERSAFDTPEN